VGLSATQVDYDDYRDVAGVKMPFKWTTSWLDGQTMFTVTQIQPNVAIDAAKFGKPAPPKPPKPWRTRAKILTSFGSQGAAVLVQND